MFGSMGASGVLGMGVMMTLHDQFSGSSDKIQNSMKKLTGMTDESAIKITRGLNMMKTGFATLGVGLALLMPLDAAVQKAGELSDQMADVRKTTGMTTIQVEGMVSAFKEIDTRTATKDLMDIAKIGGQLGVATNQIYDFTIAIDKANVALGDEFSGGAEEITKQLGTIKDLFGETKGLQYGEAMNKIGSALNSLGAAGKATGENIANFTNRIGALGAIAPTLNETLTLGATLQEVGVNGQIAAGGLTALLLTANKVTANKDRMQQWATQMGLTKRAAQDLFNASRADFILTFAKSFQGLAPTEITTRMTKLGIESDEAAKILGSLSNNTDLYASRLKLVNDQLKNATSLTDEFNIKNMTLGAVLDKMKKSWDDMTTSIGMAAAPVFGKVYEVFKKITDLIRKFAESEAGKFVIKGLAIIGMFLTFVGTILILKGAITALIAILPALGATLMAAIAPILPVVLPLVAAIGLLYYAWKSFTDLVNGDTEVSDGALGLMQRIGAAMKTVMQVWESWNGETFDLGGLEDKFREMGILDQMIALGTWIVRIKELFMGFVSGVSEVFGFLSSQFKGFKKDIGSLMDYLGINVGKLTGNFKIFADIGKVLAYVVFGPLVAGFVLLRGVLTGVAIVIAGVSALLYGLYDIAKSAASGIYEFFNSFNLGDVMTSLWEGFQDFGAGIVNGIYSGLVSAWHIIKDFLMEKLSFLGPLNPFDMAPTSSGQMVPAYAGSAAQTQSSIIETEQMRTQTMAQTHIIDKSSTTTKNVTVPVYLSGEKVAEHVVDIMGNEDSRQ